ncbi:MAG: outer membrane protein transport protein [Desulfococcaceae bacterium]|nr:outer membrane protein transport protein [Desulfococcaceae bacterium]
MEIPSSFHPVGSGARAMGMGGAFMAIADDATAASWNPGGLVQVSRAEFSLVLSGLDRKEDNDFTLRPEASGEEYVREENINFLSASRPFYLFRRNMVFSLTYQHLFDFGREWEFVFVQKESPLRTVEQWDFLQEGALTAIGLSYCIQITPRFSAGFTFSLWDDDLTSNHWKQRYRMAGEGSLGLEPVSYSLDKTVDYSFTGSNFNIGILWRIRDNIGLAAVFKTPFTADTDYRFSKTVRQSYPDDGGPKNRADDTVISEYEKRNDELDMPLSYGIGFVYDFSDIFSLSGDFFRTEWGNFVYREENGKESSAVSGLPLSESDVKAAHQIRVGAEYRMIRPEQNCVIPIRGGLFYDPAPAEGNPDDIYGFSLGLGFSKNERYSLDFAYQFRFGNSMGESLVKNAGFSQDRHEHKIYLSLILYM